MSTLRGIEVYRADRRQAQDLRIARACRWGIVGLITLYQRLISPLFPPVCRFYPCCSDYAVEAVRRHGVGRGLGLAARRLLRCHPWHPGGFDPVPERRQRRDDA